MKLFIITLTALFFFACGYEEPAASELEDTEEVGLGERKDQIENSENDETNVNVDVNVSVTVNEGSDSEFYLIYDPRLQTWDEAVENAPDGYRLPNRAELLMAANEYHLGGETVWTNESYKDHEDDVWVFNLEREVFFGHCDCLYHQTIYVSEDEIDYTEAVTR